MSNKQTVLTLALGSAIAASLGAASVSASESPFAAQLLEKGYMVAAADATDAKPAGKAAEGKCGDMKDGKASDKPAEGSCGGMKKKEGKCGGMKKMESKCGGMMKSHGDSKNSDTAKPTADKAKEATCGASMKSGDAKPGDAKSGDGKCGANMKSDDKK